MPSVEIQAVGDALADLLEGLGLWVPRTDSGACAWAPRDLDVVPAAVVQLPHVTRRGPLEIDEAPLGFNEWLLDFTVTLYVDLSEAAYAQAEVVSYLEAMIQAVNTDVSLGGDAEDSSVVSSDLIVIEDQARPMMAYECHVEVVRNVIDPDP